MPQKMTSRRQGPWHRMADALGLTVSGTMTKKTGPWLMLVLAVAWSLLGVAWMTGVLYLVTAVGWWFMWRQYRRRA
jgi:hypothetical protein